MLDFKDPKEIELNGKKYVISKFPAVQGREIVFKYPTSAVPKLGDYATNQETMLKLMNYVAVVQQDGTLIRLSNQILVNNHIDDWETLLQMEDLVMEHNCSFFPQGGVLRFLKDTFQTVLAYATKMSTTLSEQLLQTEKPPSTN